MYGVYLFDILFTWFLLTKILMISKLFTKDKNDCLERMTNHLEIQKIYHGSFLNLREKFRIL